MTKEQLFNLGYRGEYDGHDRSWIARFASSHWEMRHLLDGANAAKQDLATEERRFIPTDSRGP